MAKGFFGKLGDGPSLGVNFTPFGQWQETLRTLHRLKPAIRDASLLAQIRVCKEIEKRVKAHLRNQDIPWKPLTSKYKEQKQDAKWDSRILIGSGTYYWAIQSFQKRNFGFVGVKRGIYGRTLNGKKSRMQVADIAAIHEFSLNSKRRRPLWNPTIREMGNGVGIKNLYAKFFKLALRSKGIPIQDLKGKMPWL